MRHLPVLLSLTLAFALGGACHGSQATAGGSGGASSGSGSAGGGSGGGDGGKTCTSCTPTGAMTFALPSPSSATLWTTTTMDKVVREAAPPTTTGALIQMYAAKNEYEPFQIVVHPDADGTATLSMTAFAGPGTIPAPEIRLVGYVKIATPSDASSIMSAEIPDPLYPTTFGAMETLTAGQNQPFWLTAQIPATATAGDYTATLTVTVNGQKQDVPVALHVYDFALPAPIGFDGNWNASFPALGGQQSLAVAQTLKDFFFAHRLTPSSVAWPAGLDYDGGITYDCASGAFVAQSTPADFSVLGPEYIDGTGWNGTGFPSFEVMQFVDAQSPRPQTFCNVDRGPDEYGTAAYNAAWGQLLAAIDAYLVAHTWQDKGYYYVLNDPQTQSDYDLAAYLADITKTAAPHLRLAVGKQPLAAIVDDSMAGGYGYDLWWADVSAFDATYAATRQAAGDTVWWSFAAVDQPPYFNPITIDHAGIESRIPFWAAWKYRVRGFAYYSVTAWGSDPVSDPTPAGSSQNGDGFLLYPPTADGQLVTSIRWELLREGAEDFEYLLLTNGGKVPKTPSTLSICDLTVESAVSSLTAFTRDTSAFQHLRNQLGTLLEGKLLGCPALMAQGN
jgi:hypothetical protein